MKQNFRINDGTTLNLPCRSVSQTAPGRTRRIPTDETHFAQQDFENGLVSRAIDRSAEVEFNHPAYRWKRTPEQVPPSTHPFPPHPWRFQFSFRSQSVASPNFEPTRRRPTDPNLEPRRPLRAHVAHCPPHSQSTLSRGSKSRSLRHIESLYSFNACPHSNLLLSPDGLNRAASDPLNRAASDPRAPSQRTFTSEVVARPSCDIGCQTMIGASNLLVYSSLGNVTVFRGDCGDRDEAFGDRRGHQCCDAPAAGWPCGGFNLDLANSYGRKRLEKLNSALQSTCQNTSGRDVVLSVVFLSDLGPNLSRWAITALSQSDFHGLTGTIQQSSLFRTQIERC
ncbi:hypothetical protein C8F04DRAFT_1110599 [Mycena alexandri]|uniref:Uncharacterized protein n=1 Tax=Mycena alexandri TaxID=1745969 RepID=A0AAD6WXS9_9AGAR|nr:hypothetical protein C8F04DRAFT_1110599 [Mycena alexandri]